MALISGQFEAQSRYQALQLGAGDLDQVFVQHPISDQTTAQLQAKADAVFSIVVASLTSNERVSNGTTKASAGLMTSGADECST